MTPGDRIRRDRGRLMDDMVKVGAHRLLVVAGAASARYSAGRISDTAPTKLLDIVRVH